MKVSQRRGLVRLRLDPTEATVLVATINDLLTLLVDESPDRGDPVLRRLFPDAYLEDDRAAEFRELTGSSLRADRVERAVACRDQLVAAGGDVLLDAEAGQHWIQVLNDLRLTLGTRLGITDDDTHEIDLDGPDAHARTVYYWLSWLQESVVHALMK